MTVTDRERFMRSHPNYREADFKLMLYTIARTGLARLSVGLDPEDVWSLAVEAYTITLAVTARRGVGERRTA